jgi:hypothetical protein
MKSLVFTRSVDGNFDAYLSDMSRSAEEAQANLDEAGRKEKVVGFIRVDKRGSRMDVVAGVIEMALEVDGPNSSVRRLILEIFNLGRSVK